MSMKLLFTFLIIINYLRDFHCDNSLSIVTDIENHNDGETSVEDDNEMDMSEEPFEATHQWKEIKKGQTIGKGLHVRINLETGMKEAKLLDEEQMTAEDIADKPKKLEYAIPKQAKTRLSREEIRNAIKGLKFDMPIESDSLVKNNDNDKTNSKFRSIEDIKKEFKEMHIEVRSDTEILKGLLEKYQKTNSADDKITILNDVEYLVHQYDVAQDFVKLGGIQLLLPDLNSTSAELRSQIAFALGSAIQGNPRVQIAVIETGVLQSFLRLLLLDSSDNVQVKVLYAISCLVRNFPLAQKFLVENGGLTAFATLFKKINEQSLKLNLKVVTLLNDLLMEQEYASKYDKNDGNYAHEKMRQYQTFDLNKAIVDEGFCELIPKLLESPDNNVREKVIYAMNSLIGLCRDKFHDYITLLQQISQQLNEMARDENDSDKYFTHLYKLTNVLIANVNANIKDEL